METLITAEENTVFTAKIDELGRPVISIRDGDATIQITLGGDGHAAWCNFKDLVFHTIGEMEYYKKQEERKRVKND